MSDTQQHKSTLGRLSHDKMKEPVVHDISVQRYKGPKKPEMPQEQSQCTALSLRVLAHQAVQIERARDLDVDFFKRITTESSVPEFSGFNTKLRREQGQSVQAAARAIYTPLVDTNPADPETMLTASDGGGTTNDKIMLAAHNSLPK